MFAFKNEATVDLISQYHDVTIANRACDVSNVLLRQHASGGILRRIQNNEFGAVVDQSGQLGDIDSEIQLLAQPDRHRFRADVADHRFINWKPRIRVNHLIPIFRQRQDGEKDDGFTARNDDHFFGCNIYASRFADIIGNCLTQLGQSRGGPVMRNTLMQRVDRRINDVAWCIEIRFADFQMNNVAPLRLQCPRLH